MKLLKKENPRYEEELVKEIKDDFLLRQKERRELEQQWRLNVNYLMNLKL